MNLEYISNKIEALLNNNNNPLKDFYFYVATEGFYLDTVADLSMHKNIIPVFVNQLGGENNPIPGFGQKDFNISIHIYFPIMFKSVFYELEEYLDSLFVGQIIDFAPTGGSPDCALCNINIPKFTTIMDAGLIEFKTWTQSVYGLAVDTANFWMDMEVDLYTSTVKDLNKVGGFIYGNSWKTEIAITDKESATINRTMISGEVVLDCEETLNFEAESIISYEITGTDKHKVYFTQNPTILSTNNKKITYQLTRYQGYGGNLSFSVVLKINKIILKEQNPIFIAETDMSNATPASEQVLGENYAKGFASHTSYSREIPLYIRNNAYYASLIQYYFQRNLQKLRVVVKDYMDSNVGGNLFGTYTRTYFLTNMSFVRKKSEILGISLNLADSLED